MKRGSRKFKKIKTRINKGFKRSRLTKKRRRNVNTIKRRRNMHRGGGDLGLDSRIIINNSKLPFGSWRGRKRYGPDSNSTKAVTFYLDDIRKDPEDNENTILFTLKWTPQGITDDNFINMKYDIKGNVLSLSNSDKTVDNLLEEKKITSNKKTIRYYNHGITGYREFPTDNTETIITSLFLYRDEDNNDLIIQKMLSTDPP